MLVLCLALWDSQSLTSPGPLHPSHLAAPELRESAGCAHCHGMGDESMNDACLVCHEPIITELDQRTGLHGAIQDGAECQACHVEHVGGAIELVSDKAFESVGVPGRDQYEHDHVDGFDLVGAHDEVECSGCHAAADAVSLQPGETRFLGLDQQCARCHDDPHEGTLDGCASCHGQEAAFEDAPLFEHDGFALVDAHAEPACFECHVDRVYEEVATDCASCHTDDHEATTNPDHRVAGFGTDCSECHDAVAWSNGTFEHTEQFRLVGGHEIEGCAECHEPQTRFSVATMIEDPTDDVRGCAVCHDSPHDTGFEIRLASLVGVQNTEDTCETCHDPARESFLGEAAEMTAELHAATGFPLDDPHDTQTCADCHAGYGAPAVFAAVGTEASMRWPEVYPGRNPDDCRSCHDDPHAGQFDAGHTAGRCVECHERTHFYPTQYDAEAHSACDFTLTGSHTAVACASCHKLEGEMRRFVPTPAACAECHEDVHEGHFDRPELPAVVDTRTGCARCHSTESFRDIRWDAAEHERWGDYALVGGHAEASCRDCHRRGNARIQDFAKAPTACGECHQDSHAAQFDVAGVTDCTRCHQSTEAFTDLVFDHDTDSRFELDEHHVTLECAACHQTYPTAGASIVRYRPLGTECADCHGSPGGPETRTP